MTCTARIALSSQSSNQLHRVAAAQICPPCTLAKTCHLLLCSSTRRETGGGIVCCRFGAAAAVIRTFQWLVAIRVFPLFLLLLLLPSAHQQQHVVEKVGRNHHERKQQEGRVPSEPAHVERGQAPGQLVEGFDNQRMCCVHTHLENMVNTKSMHDAVPHACVCEATVLSAVRRRLARAFLATSVHRSVCWRKFE